MIYCLRYVLSTIHSCAIIELQKEQPPQYKGLAYKKIEIPRYQPSIQGGFSIAHFWDFRKRYLQFTKIKVSNAIMNIPKAIRSLKSYFIRTTSHLCNVGGQRPCSNTIVPCPYGNISHFNVQLLFPAAGQLSTTEYSAPLALDPSPISWGNQPGVIVLKQYGWLLCNYSGISHAS